MTKIPFDPKSVTTENPDVLRMLAVLESGGRYSGTVAKTFPTEWPVSGNTASPFGTP